MDASMKTGRKIIQPTQRWAYFVIIQVRADLLQARANLHRPGQKIGKFDGLAQEG